MGCSAAGCDESPEKFAEALEDPGTESAEARRLRLAVPFLWRAAELLSEEREKKLKAANYAFDLFVATSAEIELERRGEGTAGEAARNRLLLGFFRERKSHVGRLVESLRGDVSCSAGG